jgi:hypothetical protein
MENEQSTELAPVTTEQVTEAAPVETAASEVQPEVQKEVVSTEPRHPLMDILDKAAAKKAKAEASKVEEKPAVTEKVAESFDYNKWDGDTKSLPDKLQKIVKDNQAAFHEKAKEASTFKQQFEELQAKVNNYVQELNKQNQNKPLFTQQEFEAAQLDPTKFNELINRVVEQKVSEKEAQIAPVISEVQFQQQVVENERLIGDFAAKNKDFWNLYDAGILEPMVKELGLEAGYAKASEIAGKFQQAATQSAQARVQEKKASISVKPTNTQSIEVSYVDRPEDVLPTAMRFAAEGKKVKVKVKPR